MSRLLGSIGRFSATHPWWVIGAALALSALSALSALRIEVRTGLQDVLSKDDPVVQRMSYLNENFPSALTMMVVIEGGDKERMIAVAKELETKLTAGGKKEGSLVRQVYLEQPVDFFASRALLYLSEDELRYAASLVDAHQGDMKALMADPSLLGILRATDALSRSTFSSSEAVYTLSSRVFGNVLWDETLAGKPAGRVGVRVDPRPLQKKLRERALDIVEVSPLPPSDELAAEYLDGATQLFALLADVLEGGDSVDYAAFHARVDKMRDLSSSGALPARYRFSEDGRMLLLEIAGTKSLDVLENIRPLLAEVEAILDEVQATNRDVQLGLTGVPVMGEQEQRAILDNLTLVSLLGLLGVLAVFIIGFERIALPALSMPPLLMGILWTMGIQGLFRPELNMLNLLFPVVLFGLGIDFAIHLIAGYTERRAAGDEVTEAIEATYVAVGPGLLVGAVTTSAAFLALLVARVQGLRDLGFTAGVGVLTALLAMLIVLPALVALKDRRSTETNPPNVRFAFLDAVGRWCVKQRYPVMAGFLVATIALGYFAPRVGLERDALKIQPEGMPANILYSRVLKAYGISGSPTIFFADDIEDARRMTERAQAARTIADPLSITLAIPEDQDKKRPIIERIGETVRGTSREAEPVAHEWTEPEQAELRRRLASIKAAALELSALAAGIYTPETRRRVGDLRDVINRIDVRIANGADPARLAYLDGLIKRELDESQRLLLEMASTTSLTADDLPASLLSRVRGKDGRWIILVRANDYVYDADFLKSHVAELNGIDEDHTGLIPVWSEMLTKITGDLPVVTGMTLGVVALVVLIGLRSFRGTVLSLIPLIVGLIWTLGILGIFGLQLNFVSVLAVPLIVGIGIDDGVHLYHRVRHERSAGRALEHAGKGIILTSLTTGIGFGSLLLSLHRGVFYLGLTTAIGIIACLIVSLLLLPALIAIFQEDLVAEDR